MSYTRKFKRNYDKVNNVEPEPPKSEISLSKRIVAAVTAAGFVLNPMAAMAAIIRGDGITKVEFNNGVANVWAEKVVGNAAVNVFKEYGVNAGQIANMYFNTQGAAKGTDVDNLVNFVHSRIDVNGTVNAIQNNKIGGNLVFLSKDGMAVGKSGVINAGSLFVMTPTETGFEKLKDLAETKVNADEANQAMQALSGEGWRAIPVNASGTITVLGKINATKDVSLIAANIGVGKNVSGKEIDGVEADGVVKEAIIKTGVTNFANIVNIQDAGGKLVTSAGLADDLTATVDNNSGDIVLRGVATDVNSNDKDFAQYASNNQAKATVAVDGTVAARQDAIITAEATSGLELEKLFNGDEIQGDTTNIDAYGRVRKNVAIVDINGNVSGEHVDIQANTVNNFVTGDTENTNLGIFNDVIGIAGFNLKGGYGVLGNEATVNINKGAEVIAKDALNINAESKLRASIGASTTAIKLANIKGMANVPATAMTYAETDNKATVNISGTLKSDGDTKITANADSVLEANALSKTTQLSGEHTTALSLGVLVVDGNNASEVNITKDAEITNVAGTDGVGGEITVEATSGNRIDTSAVATGKEASTASTAINVTQYDSSANVNIDTDLKAKGDITINAANAVYENNVSADNSVGAGMLQSLVVQKAVSTWTVDQLKGIGNQIKETFLGKDTGTPDAPSTMDKVGKTIGIGASVSVAKESNTAKVNIGSGAEINAGSNDVNVTAHNVIEDTKMSATGISSNYTDESNKKVIINASVMYAGIDNEATVVTSGKDDDGNGVKLTGKNVNVTASSEFKYNRINKMIGELLYLCERLEAAYASNPSYKKNVAALKKQAKDYEAALKKDSNYADSTAGNEMALAMAAAANQVALDAENPEVSDQIKDIFTGPFSVVGAAAQFANPNNYANFQAGSSTGGKDNGKAEVAVAGSAAVTNLTNNSSVLIGKDTVIEAKRDVNINANVAQSDVTLVGKGLLSTTGGGETTVGGSVNLYFGDTNSMIVVGEGADISGNAINIASDNDITHTGVTYGAGLGGKVGVVGMVNVMEGNSNSLISIDDEASLTADARLYPEGKDNGSINITSHNDTTITNIAGNIAAGNTAAVGASVGVNMYNVNNKVVIDDNDIDSASEDEKKDENSVSNIIKNAIDDDDVLAAVLGTKDNKVNDAAITAHKLNANVKSEGMINAVTLAGSAVTGSDYDEPGLGDKFNALKTNVINKGESAIDAVDGKIQGMFDKGGALDKAGNKQQGSVTAKNPNAGQALPQLTVSGAGSSSVNVIDGDTSAVIDGVTINMNKDFSNERGAVSVGAEDKSFVGAWSGSAAINWKTTVTEQNWNNKTVGIAGAIAVNQADVDVKSIIKNSTINDAGNITNKAVKDGALIAAGLGLNVSKDTSGGGGKKYNGVASVSINLSENNIEAVMENNTVKSDKSDDGGKTNLTNSAYDNDTQVIGGINTSLNFGGENANSIGAAATVGYVTNNVTSKIIGGSYSNMGDMAVNAITDITQVSTAIGVGVSTAQEGNNIQGNVAYNQLTNDVHAGIEGGARITTDSISVTAKDTDTGKKAYDEYMTARGIDATGQQYQQNISNLDDELESNEEIFDENGNVKVGQTGNKIITGALSVAGSGNSSNSGAAAVSVSDINNDFTAKISNADIIANGNAASDEADVNVSASSNTLLVGVAAGGAGSTKGFGGAGSVTWQTLNNDIEAAIESSNINAGKINVDAVSGALAVNVAGQVSASVNGTAMGLALAYNDVENNTGAYIKGSEIKHTSTNADGEKTLEETDVTVAAENAGRLYAIGAGVGVSFDKAAASGSVAINRGNNNVEAIIEDDSDGKHSAIYNAKKVSVTTEDNSKPFTFAGGVNISGGSAAVGGAVAYNEIGNISGSEDGKKQQNTAQINNALITTADAAEIKVQAMDNASLKTIAAGVGLAAGEATTVAVQGAASTALINKNTEASMTGTTIIKNNAQGVDGSEAATGDIAGADVSVKASSENDITTVAGVVVGSFGTGAAVGAGVAVNRSEAEVNAAVSGGKMDINNLHVDAANAANITSIGLGVSAAMKGAGVSGNVAVNMIGNNTTAKIADGAQITADNNVIVDAISDEQIANYAGSLSVAGTGAGVGLSVSVNQIDGTTNATIEGNDTSVTAMAAGNAAKVKDKVDDKEILDNFVDEKAFDAYGGMERGESEYKGVAVSASSTHAIKSFLVNGGVAGTGAGVTGTINVNMIDGATNAAIIGADINKNVDLGTIDKQLSDQGLGGDWESGVNVAAHDYTNSAGIVGSVGVAGTGAGVGLGSDTNTVSRDVTAQVAGKGSYNDKGEYVSNAKNEIKASSFKVDAEAKQGISSLTTSVGVAGTGAGVSNATSVALLNGNTTAKVNNAHITADNVDVTAKHIGKLNTLGVVAGAGIIGAGVGVGVSVLDEDSVTTAEVTSSDIDITNEATTVNISADNLTKVNYQLYGIAGGAVGVAGSIGVSNINSKVNTIVKDTEIGSADGVYEAIGMVQKLDDKGEPVFDKDGNLVYEEGKIKTQDKAKNINIKGTNTIDFVNKSGSGAAGAAGIGVGVAINTIDSQVNTTVENSKLYALNDVNVTASETRTVDQLAVNAQAGVGAVGANVMITNVGKAVESTYGQNLKTDGDGNVTGGGVDIDAMYGEANKAVSGNKLDSDQIFGVVEGEALTPDIKAGKGGEQESMVKVNVTGATLDAGNKINLAAEETNNIKMDGIQASAGLAGSVSGAVGIMNVHGNSGVEVTGSTINAKDLAIDAKQKGTSDLNIYQGSLGGLATIGAAYASATTETKTGIGIGSSKFNISGDIDINANDESRTEIDAIGVTIAGGGAASVIVAEGTNKAETTITVAGTEMSAGNNIDINAERRTTGTEYERDDEGNIVKDDDGKPVEVTANSLSVNAHAGSGGLLFAGAGVSAVANEYGKVGVAIDSGNKQSAGKSININAVNAPSVSARTTAATASLLASAAITHAKANIGSKDNYLKTYVNVGDNNVFAAGSGDNDGVNFNAVADAKQNVKMLGISVQAGLPGLTGQVNVGGANAYSDVTVDVADGNTFRGETYKASDTEYANDTTNVTINGSNSVTQNIDAKGVSVSTGISSGTNLADSHVDLKTTVNAHGSKVADGSIDGKFDVPDITDCYTEPNLDNMTDAEKKAALEAAWNEAQNKYNAELADSEAAAIERIGNNGSNINNLTVKGGSNAYITSKADGSGGGLVDVSSDAAQLNNSYNAVTNVNLGGEWETAGKADVTAMNGSRINLTADAVRAAVVGGSGVWIDNVINNTAKVNVEGATVTSGGKQSYTAQNDVNYVSDLDGSGYGGLYINGSRMRDNFDFNANVNIEGSTLTGAGDEGSITAQALTTGSIKSHNNLKSAGVIPVSVADSTHAIDYRNEVKVDGSSKLKTKKKGQDITLAASDNTTVILEAIADTQGGVVGAATSSLTNTLNRSNTVTVAKDVNIESTNDVNLYAGANAAGKYAGLDINVISEAYNKTAMPIADLTLNNKMEQSNQVNAGGTVGSVRDINAKAVKGNTILIKSAKEYNIYTGANGSGSIASTDDGSISGEEGHNNVINVTGNYKAGIHNKLTLNISGETETNAGSVDEHGIPSDPKLIYDGKIEVEVTDGKDWFDPDSLNATTLELQNTLLAEYNALKKAMVDYKAGSNEYDGMKAELNRIVAKMKELNLVDMKYDKEKKQWIQTDTPVDSLTIPGIALPDIVVSGGSISLEGDSLTGGGSLTAQGAPQVTITNRSDLYLLVNDVAIVEKGGKISFNDSALSANDFGVTVKSDETIGGKPQITIQSTSSGDFNNPLSQPDIGIVGNISNDEGNILIKNSKYNINISDGAVVSGQNVSLVAEQGSVTQNSSKGLLNIGGDPISQYQFGEKVAKQIQKYLDDCLRQSIELPEFGSYDEYLRWLVKFVKVDPLDLNIFPEKITDVKYYTGILETLVEEQILKDLLKADGKKYSRWSDIIGSYKEYREKIENDNLIKNEIDKQQEAGPTNWYKYLKGLGVYVELDERLINSSNVLDEKAGILAGSNVYINAVNVNINGLVQAGYGSYSTTLTDTANQRINDITTQWSNTPLTDSEVMGNDRYLVNNETGGARWNKDKKIWEYEVKVYYNPYTQKLLVDSVNPKGGEIHINGAVSSSGNGRLMAMDGMANIDIDATNVNNDKVNSIVVNSITNKDIEGLISITDTNKTTKNSAGEEVKGLVTEYRNGSWRQYAYGEKGDKGAFTTTGYSDQYNPLEKLTYNYSGGYESGDTNYWSYKDYFMFWGWLVYENTSDLLHKYPNIKGDASVTTRTNGNGDGLATGVWIGIGESGKGMKVTGTRSKSDEEPFGDVTENKEWGWHEGDDTKDPDWVGKMFGYGRITYSWVTKNSTSSSTTSSLKADNPIQIGFIGNESNDGHISIKGNQNIEIAGNISNATVAAKDAAGNPVMDEAGNVKNIGAGYVKILSNDGSIAANSNTYINSDDVTLKAAAGIDVNINAIGDSTKINAATDAGNINIVSKNGDLNIVQAITGGVDPITGKDKEITGSTGNVAITAAGSILNATTGKYAIKGQRIDLVSTNGSIGSIDENGKVTNTMTILAGSEMTSSDSMDASVNAKAQGDIVLTQTDGNMRLGVIEATDGDAVLTVKNGSFVDAYNADNLGYSDTESKVQRWIDAGLISSKEEDDSSSKAAEQAKEERLAGLKAQAEKLANEAAEQYVADNVSADLKAAQGDIDNAVNAAVDAAKSDIQTTAQNTAAMQYEAGTPEYEACVEKLTAEYTESYRQQKQSEITNEYRTSLQEQYQAEYQTQYQAKFNDFTVAANGYANDKGIIDAKAQYIKAVTDANGDEAKTQEAYAKFTAAQAKYFGISEGGTLTDEQQLIASYAEVDNSNNYGWSKNQLLYAIQDDVINGTASKLNDVANVTAKNITLNASKGVGVDEDARTVSFNALNDVENLRILASAKSGELTKGNDGFIVQRQQAINVKSTGQVVVKGNENVYVSAVDDSALNITNVDTQGDIRLHGDKGVQMVGDGKLKGHDLFIEGVDGSIGNENKHIITELAGTLAAYSEQSAYIKQLGDMKIVAVNVGDTAVLGATGSIVMDPSDTEKIGRIEAGKSISLTAGGSIGTGDNGLRILNNGAVVNADAQTGDIYLYGRDNGEMVLGGKLVLGAVTANGGEGTLTIVSEGAIAQNEAEIDSGIKAKTVDATTYGGQALTNANNKISDYNVHALEDNTINGSVKLVTSTESGLTAHLNGVTVKGDVGIDNRAGDVVIDGGVTTDDDGNVSFNSTVGSVTNTGDIISDNNVTMTAQKGIEQQGTVTAQDNAQFTNTEGAINLGGSVTAADGNVNVHSDKGAIHVTGSVDAGKDAQLTTDSGEITTTGDVTAKNDTTVTTGSGEVTLGGSVTATDGNVNVHSDDGAITTKGSVTAGQNAVVTTGSGAINLGGNVTATTGQVTATTGSGSIDVTGNVNANKEAQFAVEENGDITLGGSTTAETVDAHVENDGNITFTGAVTSTVSDPDDDTVGNVNASIGGKGNITTEEKATIQAGNNVNMSANDGDITFKSDVNADKNINIYVNKGKIATTDGDGEGHKGSALNAKVNMTITNKYGDIDMHELYAGEKMDIIAENGNINLCDINGNIVTIVLKTPGTKQHVDKITAGSQIILEGSDIDLNQIDRRIGADGMLIITPKGIDGDNPMDKFRIGSINSKGGIRMSQIWAKEAEVNVKDGKFYIDQLFIEDEAHFSKEDFTTSVYGGAPVDDGSDSVYWNNPNRNPRTNLNDWKNAGNDDWYYLHFEEEPSVQRSNLVLVHLNDYHYAYNQRFSGENHLRYVLSNTIDDAYDIGSDYNLVRYNRYYNYDLPEMARNASEDEIVIEGENV